MIHPLESGAFGAIFAMTAGVDNPITIAGTAIGMTTLAWFLLKKNAARNERDEKELRRVTAEHIASIKYQSEKSAEMIQHQHVENEKFRGSIGELSELMRESINVQNETAHSMRNLVDTLKDRPCIANHKKEHNNK